MKKGAGVKTLPFGPWARGLQNRYPVERMPIDSLWNAVNINIGAAGEIEPRRDTSYIADDVNSLFEHDGTTYCVSNGTLSTIDGNTITAISNGFVGAPVFWTTLNNEPVCTNLNAIRIIRNGAAIELPKPAEPDGQLSEDAVDMLPGETCTYWRGRLLVARGHQLLISQPFRYGVFDPLRGRMYMANRIDWVASIESGVFVAVRNEGVYFLRGDSPEDWEVRLASKEPAQRKAVAVIPTSAMALEMQTKPDWVVVWFTQYGFAVGMPSGDVIYPQEELLSGLPLGRGSLHYANGRLTLLTQGV